jgi:hypothetical protein
MPTTDQFASNFERPLARRDWLLVPLGSEMKMRRAQYIMPSGAVGYLRARLAPRVTPPFSR